LLRALATPLVVLSAAAVLTACGSNAEPREQKAAAVPATTEHQTGEVAASTTEAVLDPSVETYEIQATRARANLERGIQDVMAYAQRLAGGARIQKGDEEFFARIGRCRGQLRRLSPPPEMRQVQALLEDACRHSQRGSLQLVDAFGMGDAQLASQAAKHMSMATLELQQVRKVLKG
jgi:hypothetical protein